MRKVGVLSFVFMGMFSLMAATETIDGITWTYTVLDGCAIVGGDSSYSTAVPISTIGAINLPAKLGGCPVTTIGPGAFLGCRLLTSVAIPAGVTEIGSGAFRNCTNLEYVELPSGVLRIGSYAFANCQLLAGIVIPPMGADGFIATDVFASCSSLRSITFLQYDDDHDRFRCYGSISLLGSGIHAACRVYAPQSAGWPSTVGGLPVVTYDPLLIIPKAREFIWDGRVHDGISTYSSSYGAFKVNGVVSAQDAGMYEVRLTPREGCCWRDNRGKESRVLTWCIRPCPISVPMAKNELIYDGSLQVGIEYNKALLLLQGNAAATNAGTYMCEVKPSPNHCWEDGSTVAVPIYWTIAKAKPVIHDLRLTGWEYGSEPILPVFSVALKASVPEVPVEYSYANAPDASESMWSNAPPAERGVWYVRVQIPEADNWEAAAAVTCFSIWDDIPAMFADHVELTVSRSVSDPAVSSPVVLVRLSENSPAGFSYARAGENGSGFAFVDNKGKVLPYFIKEWNVNGVSTLGILLPDAMSDEAQIKFYWSLKENGFGIGFFDKSGNASFDSSALVEWGIVSRNGLNVNYWKTPPVVSPLVINPIVDIPYSCQWKPGVPAFGSVTSYIHHVGNPSIVFPSYESFLEGAEFGHVYRAVISVEQMEGWEPLVYTTELCIQNPNIAGNRGDSGRVLLMNRDDRSDCPVDYQGYFDQSLFRYSTFWEICDLDEDAFPLTFNLQRGTESILWTENYEAKLWHLLDCRHGNTFPASNGEGLSFYQNYLPWSSTSRSFRNRRVKAQRNTVGQIVMRNTTNACVYSSCYADGIGTISFDAVNGGCRTEGDEYRLVVEIATNTVEGLPPTDENCRRVMDDGTIDEYGLADWHRVEIIPYVKDETMEFIVGNSTNEVSLAVQNGGTTGNFYRITAPLNIKESVRFRIRRTGCDDTIRTNNTICEDPPEYFQGAGYLLIDNIFVTKPFRPASTVSFNVGDHGVRIGGGDLIQTVTNGCVVAFPQVEAKEGWVFAGWTPKVQDVVVEDIDYLACYEIDAIPELSSTATAEQVAAALVGSVDAKLAGNIKTVAEYAAYRAWALGLEGVTAQEVKESPNAWLSYALDTDALIAAAPKEGDLTIGGFTQGSSAGVFDLSVSISGIAVGDNATAANLKKVFGVEGAGSLNESEFKEENVDIEFGKPEGGKVKIKATPKDMAAKQFFMRVKMKQ